MRIELVTAAGGYVVSGEIPPFNVPPDVIIWGQRVFYRERDDRYVEAFTHYLLPEQER